MAAKLAPERQEDLAAIARGLLRAIAGKHLVPLLKEFKCHRVAHLAQSDVSDFHSIILARLKIVELVAGLADSERL